MDLCSEVLGPATALRQLLFGKAKTSSYRLIAKFMSASPEDLVDVLQVCLRPF